MDDLIFTLLLLLIPILSIGIPIGLSYLIYFVLTKKKVNKILRILALTPVFIMIYFLYYAIYPDDDFYREEFKTVTSVKLPDSADIIKKTATYPDQHGDYTSIALIEVETSFYDNLPFRLKNRGFKTGNDRSNNNLKPFLKNKVITKEYFLRDDDNSIYYYVAFLSDKQSIIIKRTSW